MRIRIRIQTPSFDADPADPDPDPHHWLCHQILVAHIWYLSIESSRKSPPPDVLLDNFKFIKWASIFFIWIKRVPAPLFKAHNVIRRKQPVQRISSPPQELLERHVSQIIRVGGGSCTTIHVAERKLNIFQISSAPHKLLDSFLSTTRIVGETCLSATLIRQNPDFYS